MNVELEIEHIFSRKRQENEGILTDKNSLESLENKILLEKILISARLTIVLLTGKNIIMVLQTILSFTLYQFKQQCHYCET